MSNFDFIVVGSGAAGAAVAWRLCSRGYKVACVERGTWMDPAKYPSVSTDWELQKKTTSNPVSSERNNVYDYPIDDSESPIAVCNYNAVGGSTILYSGHFPRFRPRDFRIKTNDHIAEDWPISYDDLKPYFELNEQEMSVAGLSGDPFYPDIENLLPPVPLGKTGEMLGAAFNRKGWHWWPSYSAISTRQARGRTACMNLGPCNTGCPQGAKSSTDITYIKKAIAMGLTLITEAAVSRVLVDNGRAIGLRYIGPDGAEHTLYGKSVVLAASAIGTPRILLNSACERYPNGLANRSGLVGKNLMIHPLGYVEGIFDIELDTDIGPQGCMLYSHQFYRSTNAGHKLGYLMHALRGTGPVEAATSAWNKRKLRFGKDLYNDFFSIYRKQLVISIICEDTPDENNRVELDPSSADRHGVPGVKIHYRLQENTKKMMTHGMGKAKEVLVEAGAKRTYAYGPVRNTGWHVMGTTKMGHDPGKSVVNSNGKAHDIDGLFVADSSCFVTSSCVNPANTIQSLALYIADRIHETTIHDS